MRRSTSRRVLAALFALALAFGGSASLVLAASEGARDRNHAGESVQKPKKKKCNKKKTKKAKKKCKKKNKGGNNGGAGNGGAGNGGGGNGGGGGGSTAAAPPTDYIAQSNGLSQPIYPETAEEVVTLEAHDGESLYLEITRPDPAIHGEGPWPVILEASPYHGTLADREGTRMFPDPVDSEGTKIGLTGYFAPRGYAVAMFDLRGTGRSTGCLDHLGQDDAQDLTTVIEWLADQPWSNGRVGMTGHSYVGSTPSVAAAQAPEGLTTIVPSAGLASMYDHQFNKGVPWLLQWVGPMYAYEQLALYRDLPQGVPPPPVVGGGPAGDNFDNAPNPQIGCGWQNSAAVSGTGQVTGQYEGWHADRDWSEGVAQADIPIFMIHGANDNAARIPAAEWFFGQRFGGPEDKVWIGQWDHGSTNGRCGDVYGFRALHPTCRFDQMKYAIHAWFDKHLMQRDVDTGPPVEVFLNGETPVNVNQVMFPETTGGSVYTADGWQEPDVIQALYPDASTMSLGFAPPAEDGGEAFTTTAEGVLASVGRGRLTFRSEAVETDTLFLGLPQLQLNASVTNEVTHLTTTLYRERVTGVDEEGAEIIEREPMNFCAIQPQLRDGIETVSPVTPGEEMTLPMQCFTMAHHVPAGQRLALEISTGTQHHASFASNGEITVFTGPEKTRYDLPVVRGAQLWEDVPLLESYPVFSTGPAQGAATGSVIAPVPGAGQRVDGVTAVGFEFESLEGFDNATIHAEAIPTVPADIDLFLQRFADGAWNDITAGRNDGSVTEELLDGGRLPAGRYRIVVHNWAGTPNQVEVTVTFKNTAGEDGTGEAQSGTQSPASIATQAAAGYLPQP